jgi:inosine/xanthosine triphosphate pyrophosphatase family protein
MYIYEYMVTKEIILDIIKSKDNFNNLIKQFPGIYSNCVTVKQNVSNDTVNTALEKILNFSEKNEKFKTAILNLVSKTKKVERKKNDVTGLVLEIEKTDEGYSKLIEKSKKEKWFYNGLTIVNGYDRLKVFFY